jgi:hypothetical protein
LASPSLVVKEQIEMLAKSEHLRQEIAVVGAWSTVQNEDPRRTGNTVRRPVERHGRRLRIAGLA